MNRRAIIVDDEMELAEILAEYLRRRGLESIILNEGKDVVSSVRLHRPDIVLLDLMLPDVDGFTICEALKLDRDTNLIPVVMITALGEQSDRVKGLQVGANQYLVKPFTSESLNHAVQQALDATEDLKKHGTVGEIRFHLQSNAHFLEELNSLLSSLFLFSGLSQSQAKQLAIAVREMGTNAIEWGHRKQLDRIVTVDYRIDPQKITIDIKDTGPGFNQVAMPHAADGEDPVGHLMVRETLGIREGGFGILMSRGLVDELSYNDRGNEVRLVKYFPPRAHLQPDDERDPKLASTP